MGINDKVITKSIFTSKGIQTIKQKILTIEELKKTYREFNQKILKTNIYKNVLKFKKLPDDIKISTITITCAIDSTFNVENIAKYIDLSHNFIKIVKYGTLNIVDRNIAPIFVNPNKRNKTKENFYNQVSLLINVKDFVKINIKLFTNGSIQMTGCKDMLRTFWVLDQLFEKLKEVKYVMNKEKTHIVPCPFVGDTTNLNIENIKDFKIDMINSNFVIGFEINREKLYHKLIEDGHDCSYDPTVHACVNIKYHVTRDKVTSIFVFDSGSIIITGVKTCQHIIDSYEFINVYLIDNYKTIVKRYISPDEIKKISNE